MTKCIFCNEKFMPYVKHNKITKQQRNKRICQYMVCFSFFYDKHRCKQNREKKKGHSHSNLKLNHCCGRHYMKNEKSDFQSLYVLNEEKEKEWKGKHASVWI